MNTDDRELLELAAKAAGIKVVWKKFVDLNMDSWMRFGLFNPPFHDEEWNPIEDDGDALRLAVELNLDLTKLQAGISWDDPDRYAATRRAIVRAAAEIGKAMP